MIPRYRAFYKANQKMYEVLTLDIIDEKVLIENNDNPKSPLRGYVKITETELMQSTGLKDKNGVEIYEGAVVNITQYFGGHPYREIKYVVKRSKYNNNLVADSVSGDWRKAEVSMSFRSSDDYEVIGNIYENPELLEEEE